ncbi:AzlC protein [compost metagenome]
MVDLLLNTAFLLEVFLITFMVNARHLFYGITMIEPFRNFGHQKIYQSLTLNDETFMLFISLDKKNSIDIKRLYLYIAVLNHSYWIIGSIIGGLFGDLVNIPSQGIDFVMTALYIVLFVDRLENEKTHISSYIGVVSSLLCLLVFGPDNFIIPTMITMMVVFLFFKTPITKQYGTEGLSS